MNFEIEELLPIVAELVRQYTSNESTSVSYEKARQLMRAVTFCIEEAERTETTELAAVDNLSAHELYQRGYELVLRKTKKALELYHEIMERFSSYRNQALYDTMVKGMPAFFQYYDPKFQPQNRILTLDYPTLRNVEDLEGIDAIYQYLLYMQKEQEFLAEFSEEYVEEALLDYHEDYEELCLNIPSVVLRYNAKKKTGKDTIRLKEWMDMEEWLVERLYGD